MGNFDWKNILLRVRKKENVTDPRYVEYIKSRDFTSKEFDVFCSTITDGPYHEEAERAIRFLVDYKDGLLMPDRWGIYEPLRKEFSAEKVLECVRCLSFPSGEVYFKKRRKYDVVLTNNSEAMIFDGDKGDKFLPMHPGSPHATPYIEFLFYFAKQRKIKMDFLEMLLRDCVTYMQADEAIIYDQENSEILLDIFRPEREGQEVKPWWEDDYLKHK